MPWGGAGLVGYIGEKGEAGFMETQRPRRRFRAEVGTSREEQEPLFTYSLEVEEKLGKHMGLVGLV